MKKVFFLLAVAGMMSFAACNNNKTTEAPVEEVAIEEVATEEMTEEPAVEEVAVEETEATEVAE
ncbi:MAG: hypothetical protein K5650_03845 [Bacteroidales bacterium]|nr:hypothetical protein [Bacteroidales bacterium]